MRHAYGGRHGHGPPYLIARELGTVDEMEVMQWPLWRILRWRDHFSVFPPATDVSDMLFGILDRIEAVGGAKAATRTKRWQVSRFYKEPAKQKKKRKNHQKLIRSLPIKTKGDTDADRT